MLDLTFWGVRGSIPTPVPDNLGFGGNTACIAIRYPGHPLLILDAGSGIRSLGKTLVNETTLHLFLTHFHWDHIQGIPFFAPLYDTPDNHLSFHSSNRSRGLQRAIEEQMSDPYFPVDMTEMAAHRNFYDIEEDRISFDDCVIESKWLNHPQGCL